MARISEIMLLQQVEQSVLEITTKTNLQGMRQAIGASFIKVMEYMKELGETTTDLPYVSYPDYNGMDENNVTIVVGFKTVRQFADKDDIKSSILPSRKIVSALYMGGYMEINSVYEELGAWIKEQGFTQDGSAYEYYYNSPETPEK